MASCCCLYHHHLPLKGLRGRCFYLRNDCSSSVVHPTLMVAAPKAKLKKTCMRSSIPYVALRLGFYTHKFVDSFLVWLRCFPTAWIHLLAIDLFAARQVYHDGLENEIETRRSVSLCLLDCPIGILVHAITKAFVTKSRASKK